MKKIIFDNLPAGSVVLVKRYSRWKRFLAWLKKEKLKYNDAWIDPFGGSMFFFYDSPWMKHDVFTFVPKKPYSKKEIAKIFNVVLSDLSLPHEEILLKINLIRPNTLTGTSVEEMFEGNKYYTKKQVHANELS